MSKIKKDFLCGVFSEGTTYPGLGGRWHVLWWSDLVTASFLLEDDGAGSKLRETTFHSLEIGMPALRGNAVSVLRCVIELVIQHSWAHPNVKLISLFPMLWSWADISPWLRMAQVVALNFSCFCAERLRNLLESGRVLRRHSRAGIRLV